MKIHIRVFLRGFYRLSPYELALIRSAFFTWYEDEVLLGSSANTQVP